jgi:hypothetical protein
MRGHKSTEWQLKILPMRSASKAWPSRLLATVMMLALVAAYAIGAYAHAAGHPLPPAAGSAHVAWAAGHAGGHGAHHASAVSAATLEAGHAGGHHDGGGAGQSAPDCGCDTICHGGQAILAPDAPVLPQPHGVPAVQPVAAFDGAEPGGLDRPPKEDFLPA